MFWPAIFYRKNIFSLLFFSALLFFILTFPLFAQPQLLINMRTGKVLYEQQAGEAWYPASLTKLMTLYLAFEAIKSGQLTLRTPIIISKNAKKAPPSRSGLDIDSAISLEDALYLINVKSANDIAIAVAETIAGSEANFITKMNFTAKKLGMSGTNFVNSNGLHNEAQFTTARDMAILALSIRAKFPQYNDLFSTYEVRLGDKIMQSYNDLLSKFRGADGMKTGFICASGMNIVATAKRGNKYLMAIILGASSKRERSEMAALLLKKGFSGKLKENGKIITHIANNPNSKPKNMRPLICGSEANNYLAKRRAAFPYGLKGEISNLGDIVLTKSKNITPLGKMRNVPLPKKRPDYIMPAKIGDENYSAPIIILPRPRPNAD